MEIDSVQEYINIIERLSSNYTIIQKNVKLGLEETFPPRLIYRGHGNHAKYKVLPGIFGLEKVLMENR